MITYEELLQQLRALSDEAYRAFHTKLLKDDGIRVIGVRTPPLRRLARAHKRALAAFLAIPAEF